jgi:hypothetical protein
MTDGADINGPGIVFRNVENSQFHQACSFEDKLNNANAGICGAYKELWTKVPYVQKVLYREDPAPPQDNWFSELMNFEISSDIANQYKTLQDKYHPTREYALHPALSSAFYMPDENYGSERGGVRKGFRDSYYRPIIDLDITIPPFMNLYFHYLEVSAKLKAENILPVPEDRTSLSEKDKPVEKLRMITNKMPAGYT